MPKKSKSVVLRVRMLLGLVLLLLIACAAAGYYFYHRPRVRLHAVEIVIEPAWPNLDTANCGDTDGPNCMPTTKI